MSRRGTYSDTTPSLHSHNNMIDEIEFDIFFPRLKIDTKHKIAFSIIISYVNRSSVTYLILTTTLYFFVFLSINQNKKNKNKYQKIITRCFRR